MKNKILFLLILTLSINISAQSPEKLLKLAEKALGGTKNLQAIRSFRQKGNIERLSDGANGKILLQTSQPSSYNLTYDLNGFETEIGYNGKSGWKRNSREAMQTLTGNASRDLAVESDFRNTLWLDYKKDKSKISTGGSANVNGKTAKIVNLTSVKGVTIKLFFDAATNLPVRMEFPSGDTIKVFDFDDYRTVNSIKVPFSVNLKQAEDVYKIKFESAEINQTIAKTEFDFPNLSGEPLPDIKKLLQELQNNSDKKNKLLEDYSFTQKTIHRDFGKDGVLHETESSTYQMSFYKGYRISRLIEKNGKPLNEKDQKKSDEDAQKAIEKVDELIAKRQATAAKQAASGKTDEENGNLISEWLRASNLINPRRERFRGRDVIVFDFEPNQNFDYKNAKSMLRLFGKTAGVMWIDEKDKEAVRIEAVLADSFSVGGGLVAKLKKGASFVLEQDRINDEVWLPSLMDINMSVRLFLVKGMNLNQTVTSYNFNKFNTEVKDSKIDEAKKP